jgi:hypothetical protein
MKDQEARSAIGRANGARLELRKDIDGLRVNLAIVKEHLGSVYQGSRAYIMGPDPVADRLRALEGKMDALMKHLGCHFEVPDHAPPYEVVQEESPE